MNENKRKDWPKGPSAITENSEKNDKDSETVLLAFDEKDILERYLDDNDDPSAFFKGATISFFLCLLFWVALIILLK
ncbi:MAG: hypothetical protein LJE66_10780 [Desulfobacterales bacterium]|jgi:hypothetical protein|nr:hypothetical protein [Desulfobacterales bacterium]